MSRSDFVALTITAGLLFPTSRHHGDWDRRGSIIVRTTYCLVGINHHSLHFCCLTCSSGWGQPAGYISINSSKQAAARARFRILSEPRHQSAEAFRIGLLGDPAHPNYFILFWRSLLGIHPGNSTCCQPLMGNVGSIALFEYPLLASAISQRIVPEHVSSLFPIGWNELQSGINRARLAVGKSPRHGGPYEALGETGTVFPTFWTGVIWGHYQRLSQ